MHKICGLAWNKGKVRDDRTKAMIIPMYKGKGSRSECDNCGDINLLSIAGKDGD